MDTDTATLSPETLRAQMVAKVRKRDNAQLSEDRHDGHYASHRLRRALLFLETLGVIVRAAEGTNPQIAVTDRARLGELRRRWDEKHFGV
jgi:hypothetical protein